MGAPAIGVDAKSHLSIAVASCDARGTSANNDENIRCHTVTAVCRASDVQTPYMIRSSTPRELHWYDTTHVVVVSRSNQQQCSTHVAKAYLRASIVSDVSASPAALSLGPLPSAPCTVSHRRAQHSAALKNESKVLNIIFVLLLPPVVMVVRVF